MKLNPYQTPDSQLPPRSTGRRRSWLEDPWLFWVLLLLMAVAIIGSEFLWFLLAGRR